jgi:glycosyltransferase involved in cell wall biosynthesis
MYNKENFKITIGIPCYNEEISIGKVVSDFRSEIPESRIIVIDNNSKDKTSEKAKDAGAEVFFEKKLGKGNAVRKLFEISDEDILILVDGDDTYFAKDVKKLIQPILENKADMVVGNRFAYKNDAMNESHNFGNKLFRLILNLFFNTKFKDILSGYRAFNKEFYKNTPLLSEKFEIETEMTLQALERNFNVIEIPINYQKRPAGSHSKIKEFRDGSKIIFTITSLLRDYRPMTFFSILGSFLILIGFSFGTRVLIEYIKTGIILRVPTAILTIALVILGFNSFLSGLTVSAINRRNRELENIIKRKK